MRLPNPAALEIGPVTRLVHRFEHLPLVLQRTILKHLHRSEEDDRDPNVQFREFVATLKPKDAVDREQLAALWHRVDAAHPSGPAQEGNQFLSPA